MKRGSNLPLATYEEGLLYFTQILTIRVNIIVNQGYRYTHICKYDGDGVAYESVFSVYSVISITSYTYAICVIIIQGYKVFLCIAYFL